MRKKTFQEESELVLEIFQVKTERRKKINNKKKMEVNKRRVLKFDPCSISDSETRFEIQCCINDENPSTDTRDMKKVICFGNIWSEMTRK